MGRKKKNDSGKLAALAREYYEKEAFGNPKKLKCSNFARYAREHGCNAQAYDFRRDREVRAFMDEVLGGHEDADEYPLQAVYRNLDIDALLLTSRSMEDFKRTLREMDAYWHRVYDAAVKAETESRTGISGEAEALHESMRRKVSSLETELAETERARTKLEEECRYLRHVLKKYLYPAVAEELLRRENLPVPENTAVRPESFGDLIEGSIPMGYEGKQGRQPGKESRQERLLSLMKAQVSDGK